MTITDWLNQKPCITKEDCDPGTCLQEECLEYVEWIQVQPPIDVFRDSDRAPTMIRWGYK